MTIPRIIRRLVCRMRGHDWNQELLKVGVRQCNRCPHVEKYCMRMVGFPEFGGFWKRCDDEGERKEL